MSLVVVGNPGRRDGPAWRSVPEPGIGKGDPDGDGRPNLLEYALGSDPLVTNSAPSATPALVGTYLTLTFQRIADPLLVYEVWASNDLVDWGAAPIWTSTGATNVAGSVTVTDGTALSGANARRFLRLRVHL